MMSGSIRHQLATLFVLALSGVVASTLSEANAFMKSTHASDIDAANHSSVTFPSTITPAALSRVSIITEE